MLSVKATWTPSPTPSTTKQVIVVFINDSEFSRTELPVTDSENTFGVNPGDNVRVDLFATNLVGNSPVVSASMVVPNIPEPPSGLVLDLVVDNE